MTVEAFIDTNILAYAAQKELVYGSVQVVNPFIG